MTDISNQTEYWDNLPPEKEFSLDIDLISFGALVPDDAKILDYGCGYGRIAAELHEYGYSNIIGVDVSPEMIKRARLDYPQLKFEIIEGNRLPYQDASFDAALLIGVLTAVPDTANQKAVVAEIFRVLKPGGFLYVTDFCLQSDDRNLERYRKYEKTYGTYGVFELPEGVVLRHHDLDYIYDLLSDFELISLVIVDAVTMNNNPAKAFQYFGRKPRPNEE